METTTKGMTKTRNTFITTVNLITKKDSSVAFTKEF